MAPKSDVVVRDMGWERATDRLLALQGRSVVVGPLKAQGRLAKYSEINEIRYGWKTRADRRVERMLPRLMEAVQNRVVAGDQSFKTILGDFGERLEREYRAEIRGLHGLMSPTGKPGLYDTGAMQDAITYRASVPK